MQGVKIKDDGELYWSQGWEDRAMNRFEMYQNHLKMSGHGHLPMIIIFIC